MRIIDLNTPSPAPPAMHVPAQVQGAPAGTTPPRAAAAVVPLKMAAEVFSDPLSENRAQVEIALLRARIEHLELVIEAARGLMTANQEKLLRRLHEVPRELSALSARLGRMTSPDEAEAAWAAPRAAQGGQK